MKENSEFVTKILKYKPNPYKWIYVKYNNINIQCKIINYTKR